MLSTQLLRTSEDQPYKRLRQLLPAQGVNVSRDVLADLFPDDGDQEFGIVVSAERRVFTFVLHYGQGDLTAQAANAIIGEWNDISDRWEASPYTASVREAMRILE